jgi:large subunit ribosomal protein L29
MKIHEVRQLSDDEIRTHIAEEQNNLLDLRFQHSLKQLTNTTKIRQTKQTIARLYAVLTERENTKQSAQ